MQVLSIVSEITDSAYLKVKEKLKYTKGVNGRWTHTTMGIRKKNKVTNNDLHNTSQKTNIGHHEPH